MYVNFTRLVRDKAFLVTRSNIEGQGNTGHKTKSYIQAIIFLSASWIAMIVRMFLCKINECEMS